MLNLSLPELLASGEPESRIPWDDIATLIDQLTYYHPSTREWFETKGRDQLKQATENSTLQMEEHEWGQEKSPSQTLPIVLRFERSAKAHEFSPFERALASSGHRPYLAAR
jgi:hypothetical protein